MKFLSKLIMIFVMLLASVFSAAAFSDTLIMNQNDFNVQFYNCNSDSTCSNPTLVSEQHVNGNNYTFSYNTNDYFAEYIFKEGYLAKGFIVNKYTGTNTYNFEKKNNGQSRILSLSLSDSEVNQGENVNVSAFIASAFSNASPGTPMYRPLAYSDFFDADTRVTLQLIQNNTVVQESTQDISIYMNDMTNVNFNINTNGLNGNYIVRIITNVTDNLFNQDNTILFQTSANLNVLTTNALQAPVAIAGPDRNVNANQSIVFDGSASYDPDGTIVNYLWNFGDGNTASGLIQNHIYTNLGNYTVTLIVTDNSGLQNQDNLVVTVTNIQNTNQNPVANAGPDRNVNANQSIVFDGSASYDPDGTIVNYLWNFGDGNTASGLIQNHIYASANTYTVTLIVTDNNGAQNTDSALITITNPGNNNTNNTLQLSIDADPINGTLPLEVEFDSDVSGNGPFTYYWDFDDGTHSTQANPVHIFNKTGHYDVELEVKDLLNNTLTRSITITVNSKNNNTNGSGTSGNGNTHRLSIDHISLNSETFNPGDTITINTELRNNGGYNENSIVLNALLTELGLSKSSSTITLSQGSNKWQSLELEIPEDVQPGLYNLRIKLSNSYSSDTEYKTITILNKNSTEVLLAEGNEKNIDWLTVIELAFLSLFIVLLILGILLLIREIRQIS